MTLPVLALRFSRRFGSRSGAQPSLNTAHGRAMVSHGCHSLLATATARAPVKVAYACLSGHSCRQRGLWKSQPLHSCHRKTWHKLTMQSQSQLQSVQELLMPTIAITNCCAAVTAAMDSLLAAFGEPIAVSQQTFRDRRMVVSEWN
jgi:hypothetical protein